MQMEIIGNLKGRKMKRFFCEKGIQLILMVESIKMTEGIC